MKSKNFYERNSSRGQNLYIHFWMTDVQKTLHCYSHLKVRMIRNHGESKKKGVHTHTLLTRRILGGAIRIGESHTFSIEKKIGKEFMYED